jgi:hypothetical protein
MAKYNYQRKGPYSEAEKMGEQISRTMGGITRK